MNKNNNYKNKEIILGDRFMTIDDVCRIASRKAYLKLNNTPEYINKINKGAEFIESLISKEGEVYGVTTGYGDSCTTSVPEEFVKALPLHLSRFHNCGMGRYFTIEQTRAIMVSRLSSLSLGVSGVRYKLLKQIEIYLDNDIYPLIPEEGSVGASGDLTPLSYICSALVGEGNVYYENKIKPTKEVLTGLQINPIELAPKEALAIMNGTAVMTALACQAYDRARYLNKLASRLTAMAVIALKGNKYHYNERLFAVKPHQGQMKIAKWIREDLNGDTDQAPQRLQDRYSLRCAPHIIGTVEDALPWLKQIIETELNSANDNPVVDAENQKILHGGHFYGGHIAMAMDTLKTQVANLADLLDRQMALLMDVKFNNGLPANLTAAIGERARINHGFKAVQIGVSAWTAEALKLTMPASVFSRSTECHNQDKVSMGTIAARDCLRVLELTEQVFSAHLLALTQAIKIRLENQDLKLSDIPENIQVMVNSVSENFTIVREDRALEASLREYVDYIQQQKWTLYED